MTHSGPTTANAQTAVVNSNTQVGQDREIQDDNVSLKSSSTVQQRADINENDKADSNSSTHFLLW